MAHPFKLNCCVLLLDPLAVMLSSSQCSPGPAPALRMWQFKVLLHPRKFELGNTLNSSVTQMFPGANCSAGCVGTLERSPCEHQ